jgi:hypothetical protein
VAHFGSTDVKTSVIKLNFAISPQNVSNAVETNFPVNARNQNKTPLNAQTVTNNIRANFTGYETITKYTQGSQLTSNKHLNVNKQNVPCLIENNFPNLPQSSSSCNWHNRRKLNPTTSRPRKIDQHLSQQTTETTEKLFLSLSKK